VGATGIKSSPLPSPADFKYCLYVCANFLFCTIFCYVFMMLVLRFFLKKFYIFEIYSQHNLHERIPKLTILINHEEWFIEDTEWGITNQVIFQALVVLDQWWQFSSMIRTLLSYLAMNQKLRKYFIFWITSSVGWWIKEFVLFQPSQCKYGT